MDTPPNDPVPVPAAPEAASATEAPRGQMPKFANNRELLVFLFLLIRENRKWWLLPMWLVLALLGLFVSLTGNTSMLPAIYALF